MNTFPGFEGIPVLGNLPPEQILVKLHEVEEVENQASDSFVLPPSVPPSIIEYESPKRQWSFTKWFKKGKNGISESSVLPRSASLSTLKNESSKRWRPFPDRAWLSTAYAFGYLAPTSLGSDTLPIRPVSRIDADANLRNKQIKITLNRLRVASYPGGGEHRILLHFYTQNHLFGEAENLHFNVTCRVNEGEAAISGYPIFIGLSVDNEGLSVGCRTIDVKNDQDEPLLDMFESDVFRAGLHLTHTVQPAIALQSAMALGVARFIAKRPRNISVQDFHLGLDFSNLPVGAHLAEGSYLAVQIPQNVQVSWNWDDWVYLPQLAQVVKRTDHERLLPYNYLILGISLYEES